MTQSLKVCLSLALLVGATGPLLAYGDEQRISLGEALEVAVRQSPTLADATIDVAIADARAAATLGAEDWLLAARLSFLISRDEAQSGNVVGTDKVDSIAAETTLSKLLKTGATIGVTASGSYSARIFELSGAESTSYETGIEAFVSQPLLRGRGEQMTRAQNLRARADLDAAELSRQAAARGIVRDVVDAYWQLALSYRALEIRRSSLELARERRRLTEASVGAGRVAQTELDAVDQIIATREEEILAAELLVSERAIELRRLAGLEIGPGSIDLVPSAALGAPARTLDERGLIEKALATSPELAILAARGEGSRIDVSVAENGLLPRLDVSLRGGPIGTGGAAADSFENLVKVNGYQIAGALDFSHELGTSGAKASTLAAREGLRKLEVSARDVQAQIAVAVVRAVKQAENAAARIKISERVIELTVKNVEAEKARFELGRSTNFDILERQEEQKQANLRLAQATADYLRALNILDELTGVSLDQNGITLPPLNEGR